MKLEFDPAKRLRNIEIRELDFLDCAQILQGPALTFQDIRVNYGEVRWITIGLLQNRMMVVTWTQRGQAYRIISMRKANDKEQETYSGRLV